MTHTMTSHEIYKAIIADWKPGSLGRMAVLSTSDYRKFLSYVINQANIKVEPAKDLVLKLRGEVGIRIADVDIYHSWHGIVGKPLITDDIRKARKLVLRRDR